MAVGVFKVVIAVADAGVSSDFSFFSVVGFSAEA